MMIEHISYLAFRVAGISAAIAGLLLTFLDGVTNLAPALEKSIVVIASAVLSLAAVALKLRYDRWKFLHTQSIDQHRTDTTMTIERERLLDKRADSLFDDMTSFYGLRDKEKDTLLTLQKETFAITKRELESIIEHQRALIVQQASALQDQQPKR